MYLQVKQKYYLRQIIILFFRLVKNMMLFRHGCDVMDVTDVLDGTRSSK